MAEIMERSLGLRWSAVAVKLLREGEPAPADTREPRMPVRHCQSLVLARRGKALYIPLSKHACPDGAANLGLREPLEKLMDGSLYLAFQKLGSLEAARRMAVESPRLHAGTFAATAVMPLAKASFQPDVVVITGRPEQIMWACAACVYHTGERLTFNASGYNAGCVECVVVPAQTGRPNLSLGCYGCRSSTEMADDELAISIPGGQLPQVADALVKLAEKAIPEERAKINMAPFV
jgi:uncharacterized protein (DUF169 family)